MENKSLGISWIAKIKWDGIQNVQLDDKNHNYVRYQYLKGSLFKRENSICVHSEDSSKDEKLFKHLANVSWGQVDAIWVFMHSKT